jgi:hypothetical protein
MELHIVLEGEGYVEVLGGIDEVIIFKRRTILLFA